jgi:hypothetical protein
MTTLKEIIEYALIEKGLVHQLGAEFITGELAPFIAGKIEEKLNKEIDTRLQVAREALLLISEPKYQLVGYLKNMALEAIATINGKEQQDANTSKNN